MPGHKDNIICGLTGSQFPFFVFQFFFSSIDSILIIILNMNIWSRLSPTIYWNLRRIDKIPSHVFTFRLLLSGSYRSKQRGMQHHKQCTIHNLKTIEWSITNLAASKSILTRSWNSHKIQCYMVLYVLRTITPFLKLFYQKMVHPTSQILACVWVSSRPLTWIKNSKRCGPCLFMYLICQEGCKHASVWLARSFFK